MKKLSFLFAMIFAVSMAMGQTELDLDQSAPAGGVGYTGISNAADIVQSDASAWNAGAGAYTKVTQIGGTSNDLFLRQLERGNINLYQNAGTENDADIYQRGSGDNEFDIDQRATAGYNSVYANLSGSDVHGLTWEADQRATGNNDLSIRMVGDHNLKHSVDIYQNATDGDNFADLNMDNNWSTGIEVNTTQISEDNYMDGDIDYAKNWPGTKVDVDIYQDAPLGINEATFRTNGDRIVLDVRQSSLDGNNTLTSYQEWDSSAIINQSAVNGNNVASINQTNP